VSIYFVGCRRIESSTSIAKHQSVSIAIECHRCTTIANIVHTNVIVVIIVVASSLSTALVGRCIAAAVIDVVGIAIRQPRRRSSSDAGARSPLARHIASDANRAVVVVVIAIIHCSAIASFVALEYIAVAGRSTAAAANRQLERCARSTVRCETRAVDACCRYVVGSCHHYLWQQHQRARASALHSNHHQARALFQCRAIGCGVA
jgi:hypothetical protein